MKFIMWAIGFFAISVVGFVALELYGGSRKWKDQEVGSLFAEIFDRSIQLERTNVIGVQEFDTPQISIPSELFQHPEKVSCDSLVIAKTVDPSKFFTTDVIIISDFPLSVLAIFAGDPPDIITFLRSDNLEDYLGPQLKYVPNHILDGPAALGPDRAQNDVWLQYKKYVGERHLSIVSAQCKHFSYSIVEE